MANKQISQLTAKPTPVASTDQFGIDDNSSQSWKITVANLQTYFSLLYLTLSGGTMTGNLTLAGDPTTNLMAATKQYVDAVATGLNIQPSCRVASTTALTVTYSNGTAGVGATLTNAGAQVALSIDGITLALNDRVLIKNQASSFQNGIYTATNLGSGATNWVLTRATDYDTSAEVTPGDFVLILSGTANAQTQWVQTATVVTMGTDAITWEQFSADVTAVITNIQNSAYVYSEDTGAADAYVATLTPALAAYVEGTLVILDVANANTGASTINVNGLGVKNIVTPYNTALLAGDMVAGRRAWLLYDGTSFRIVNRNIEKRNQDDSFNYILDTGAADAYVATLVPSVTAYVAGQRISLKIANTNTSTCTLNVNGLGTKAITNTNTAAMQAGQLVAGMIADLRYDGTQFQLLNPAKNLAPTVQKFTSGSGTYTTPAGVAYIRVLAVAGGGGGAGSGSTDGGSQSAGGDTTFGTIISLAGGTPGTAGSNGGAGGTGGAVTTMTASPGGMSVAGGGADGGMYGAAGAGLLNAHGGHGAASFLGGSSNTTYTAGGTGGVVNSGGGGGGGACTTGVPGGGGGGSGAGCDVIIAPPAATYAYAVGAAGVAGVAGTGGTAGTAGGSGVIVVYEFYK